MDSHPSPSLSLYVVKKTLLSFVMKTRLERKVIWNGSGRSCNSNTILDLSILGDILSVDVLPARCGRYKSQQKREGDQGPRSHLATRNP